MKEKSNKIDSATLDAISIPETTNTDEINDEVNDTDYAHIDEPSEERELTEEEKNALFVQNLKDYHKSKSNYRTIKHNGNITTNQFGYSFKKKRQAKNRVQKKSRRANRK